MILFNFPGEFGRIQAYDKDIGVNAELTYSLDDASFKYFKMNQDRETNQGVLVVFSVCVTVAVAT